jgi:broad specificity phosphatase PhoE
VQARVVEWLDLARERHRGATIAAVSHADVIRAALCHYAGISLDHFLRPEVAPASVAALELGPWRARVLSLGAGLPGREP